MNESKMKNMIVLKNLPSNLIEEAFVVLKSNKKIKLEGYVKKTSNSQMSTCNINNGDYLVKEAEMVISNYLSNIENNKKMKNNYIKALEKKYKRLKKITYILSGTFIVGILIGLF